MKLYINSSTDFKIVDENKKEYSIDQAKEIFESQIIDDFNVAFKRLVEFNFNLDLVKEFYKENK